jgi:hypothetical protein
LIFHEYITIVITDKNYFIDFLSRNGVKN